MDIVFGELSQACIHYRAHLCVYMRMNDISVPALYGPSGDEHSSTRRTRLAQDFRARAAVVDDRLKRLLLLSQSIVRGVLTTVVRAV